MQKQLSKFRKKNLLILCLLSITLTFPIIINTINLNSENPDSIQSGETQEKSIHSSVSFSDFKYYKEITIDSTEVMGSGYHYNFPILLNITDQDLHNQAQTDGDDIAFANETDWLDFEIELFDQDFSSTHAHLVAWINIPELSTSTDTIIYMYYGNPTMTSQENPSGVWNSNYKAVWHLNKTLLDSTINHNDGTNSDPEPNDVSSLIGRARDYYDSDYSNMGSDNAIDDVFNGGATISVWIYPEGWGGNDYGRILDKSAATIGTNGWVACLDGGDPEIAWHNQLLFYRDFSDCRGLWMTGDDTINLFEWQYITITYDDSSEDNDPTVYINGISQSLTEDVGGNPQGTAQSDSNQDLYIGNYLGGTRGFDGVIDEVRVQSGIKTSGWILTEYNNQHDPNSFYIVGSAVSIDITPPDVNIIIPCNNDLFGSIAPNFNVEINDTSGVDTRWYRLLNGTITTANTTFTTNSTIDQIRWNEIGNGTVTIQFFANDTLGNIGSSEITVRKDKLYPSIIINSPSHLELFGSSPPGFNINVWDTNGVNKTWYTLDNGPNALFTSNGTISSSLWNTCGNGPISIKFYANDSLGNGGFSEVIVNKTISAPTIQPISPILNELFGITPPNYIVEISDENGVEDMWYTLNNGPNEFFTSNSTLSSSLWNICGNGTVSIKFYANNSLGNGDFTEVIVRKDIIGPTITINNPDDYDTYGKSPPSYNVLIDDPNGINSKWYTLDDGITNTTFISNGIIDQNRWDQVGNGTVIIRFYANDSMGNVGFSEVGVYKDVIGPTILINSPDPYDLFGITAPSFNISIIDSSGISSREYSIDGGLTNITFPSNSWSIYQPLWNLKGNGTVTIQFFVRDSLGNKGFAEVIVRKDIIPPSIKIENPLSDQVFGETPPSFNVELSDANGINTMWYRLQNGTETTTNTTFITNGTINSTLWGTFGDGEINIQFYGNDSMGNIGFTEVNIYKDILGPIIQINSPDPYELFGKSSPSFNIELFDSSEINLRWYTINGGLTNITFTSNITIDQNLWDLQGNGTVTIQFFAKDSFGYEGFSEVIVRKDIDPPSIKINNPLSNQVFGETPPSFNVELSDANSIDTMWYRLQNGTETTANNTFITNGTINSTLWDTFGDGDLSIQFYANDSLGNKVFSEVLVKKDIDPPLIKINNPLSDQVFGEVPPSFNVEISDTNGIDTMWYCLQNGTETTANILFTTNESINSTLWGIFGDGNINIRFYANDSMGNMIFSDINIIKDIFAPTIDITTPSNYSYCNHPPIFNIHTNDVSFDSLWIRIGNVNISIDSDEDFQLNSSIWDSLSQGLFQIHIYANDTLGHLNTKSIILCKDTICPNAPILISSPTGEVSIPLIFDWEDGVDASGVAYYRLIIDNEVNPFLTPGYIFEVNITNQGSSSSYYELTEFLSPRNYHFFIYCVDEAGNQGDAASGTFIVAGSAEPSSEFPWWIILIVALPLGVIIAFVALKKSKKVKVVVVDKEVEALKEQKKQLEMKARSALKAGNYQDAADLYAQCRIISNQLIENGIEEEKDKFRNFDKIEKELQLKLASIPLTYTCINHLMTMVFDQLGIKYYSNPDIYPETQNNMNGLILNDAKFLENRLKNPENGEQLINDLSIKPDTTTHINGIQFLYTNDLSEESIIKLCEQYQNPQMLLLIVGVQWPNFEYDETMAVPRDVSIKYRDNIRILNKNLLVRLIGIQGKYNDMLNEIIELNFNYQELEMFLKKIETNLHDTEELKEDLKRMEWFFFL